MSELENLDLILECCKGAVRSVDPGSKERLVDAILGRRKIFVYGSGRSGLVGQMFAVRLVQLGLDVHFIGEMTTPMIGRDDLTLLISFTGRTSSVVQTAQIARRIGSETISVTGTRDCPLVEVSDCSVVMDVPDGDGVKEAAPLGTIFEDSALLLFDCVVGEIMERESATEGEMRGRHAIWVRSLGHERGRQSVPLRIHGVDGELPGIGVYDDEYAFAASFAEGRDHFVGGVGPLRGEEHARLRVADPLHGAVASDGVGHDAPRQAARRGRPLRGVEYRGHGSLGEDHVGAGSHSASHMKQSCWPTQMDAVFHSIGGGRRDPA